MTHFFNSEMAEYTSTNAAIVYSNMKFWHDTNKANGSNYFEDKYWFYSSNAALRKFHPYLGEKAIRSAIELLIKKGFVLKGNFNKKQYDRTLWYHCTPLFKEMFESAKVDVPDAPEEPVEDYINEKAFIDRWNAIGHKKIRNYPTELLSKIRSRVQYSLKDSPWATEKEAIDFFFEQLDTQPYLKLLSWFNLKYCVRSDEKYNSILFHEHAWQKEKLAKGDLNTQGDENGTAKIYSC